MSGDEFGTTTQEERDHLRLGWSSVGPPRRPEGDKDRRDEAALIAVGKYLGFPLPHPCDCRCSLHPNPCPHDATRIHLRPSGVDAEDPRSWATQKCLQCGRELVVEPAPGEDPLDAPQQHEVLILNKLRVQTLWWLRTNGIVHQEWDRNYEYTWLILRARGDQWERFEKWFADQPRP